MHPSLQLSVLDQVTSKRIVGMDSMNLWIETTSKELRDVLKRADILKLDDAEARQLSGEYNLRKAAAVIQKMGPRMLIATRGSHGSMLFNEDDIFDLERTLNSDRPVGFKELFRLAFLLQAHA